MTPVGSGRRGHCSPVADGRTVLPTPTRDRTGGTNLGRRSRTRERTLSRGGSREGSRTQVTSRVTGSSAFGPGRASGRQRSSSHQARSHHQRTDRPPGIRGAISRPGATRPARAAGPLASRAHGLSKPSGRRIGGGTVLISQHPEPTALVAERPPDRRVGSGPIQRHPEPPALPAEDPTRSPLAVAVTALSAKGGRDRGSRPRAGGGSRPRARPLARVGPPARTAAGRAAGADGRAQGRGPGQGSLTTYALRLGRAGVAWVRRATPRASRSAWMTRAAATSSGSRVTVPATQSI
jgi:hypothetical protein